MAATFLEDEPATAESPSAPAAPGQGVTFLDYEPDQPAATAPPVSERRPSLTERLFGAQEQAGFAIEMGDMGPVMLRTSPETQAAAKVPSLTLPKTELRQEDSLLRKAGGAAWNTVAGFVEGVTSPEGLEGLINPFVGVGQMGMMVPQLISTAREAHKTPANSPERWQAAANVIGALALPVAAHGAVKLAGRKPTLTERLFPETTERPAGAPPTLTERLFPTETSATPEGYREITPTIFEKIRPEEVRPQVQEIPPRTVGEPIQQAPMAEVIAPEPDPVAASAVSPKIQPKVEPAAAPAINVPEHLRVAPEIARLLEEPDAQTGPQMKPPQDAPEGGALFGKGGATPQVKPLGATPRGDTEFLRIEHPLKRAFKGLEREGAGDVIGHTKNKVGQMLSQATRKHVDLEQELFGQLSTEFQSAVKGMASDTAAKAFDEVAPYLAAKENGRPLPTLSADAQKLVNAWENIAEQTGQISTANAVQVFDPTTGAHRPMHAIGRDYVPRMLKQEVEQVLRDPDRNTPLFNNLVNDFATHKGITPDAAAQELRATAGRFASNDFMGNLEMARVGKLPESFYEYDLRNLASRYIPNFSERMSQIIAYGQRIGPRESPQRPNLWDVARKEAGDTYTQEWLNNAENQATNLKLRGASSTGMARAQTLASGLLLSNPFTTVPRNLFSGVAATPELLGIRRSIKALADTAKISQAKMSAVEIGTVRDNIGDFLHADRLGDSPIDDAIRAIVDTGLKVSGYNGSETFVRTHGAMTASHFAKDGVAAILKNPASMRSKEALGLFKRMGVDAEKIVAEGADWKTGPETREFIRTVIRETQGGYRFDQVPLWANSNMGRFFYQFGRWGTQRARNIWRNGIKPALGEEVQWNGKTMTRRDVRPLMKMAASTVALGETFAGIAQVLFGRDRRDASLSEISAAWDEDKKTAVALAMERVVNDVIMAGTLGIWSQPVDWAKGLKDQSRLKNPTEPPGISSVRAFTELGQNMIDQGGVTRRDLVKFSGMLTPGLKQGTDVARNVFDEPLYEAENDIKTLRSAAQRWAKRSGMDVAPRAKNDFRKSEKAPTYEPIKEALLVGNAEHAKYLVETYLDSQSDRAAAVKSLKASVKQSQPFRAGPYTAEEHRQDFDAWAKRNLSAADYQQTIRVQERYMKAAKQARLW